MPQWLLNFFVNGWNKCPWWIKWPFVVVVGPNLTVNFVLFVMFFTPWIDSKIKASIVSTVEKSEMIRKNDLDRQILINKHIEENVQQILQNQSLMYSELIRRNSVQP